MKGKLQTALLKESKKRTISIGALKLLIIWIYFIIIFNSIVVMLLSGG
jgi:hypothetical protein